LIDRVLIVGYGSIGKRHLGLARKLLPGADIRVLRHQVCESIPEFADGCFSDLEKAIAFAPQVAVVANPATRHIPIAIGLAQAGAHLLVEKPLADTAEVVSQLLEICRAKKTVLMTAYNLRFLPSLERFRALLMEGLIGKVLSVRCEIGQYLPSWRPGTDYRQGVSARKELGGGALLELSHEIDYLRWIFGDIDWVKATLLHQSDLEIDVEDAAHLILGFEPDREGRRLVATVNMDFIRHDATRVCTAVGKDGSLRWNGLTGLVEWFEPGKGEWTVRFHHQHQRDDSYLAEWKHFLSCIENSTIPLVSGEDGLRVLEITDAAREAAASGGAKVSNATKNEMV
jgi:predicted dehydrogenase